ncbi:MAG: hypothetical protein WAT39_04825, partial [Planctomycetota bacterium]
MTNIHRGSLVLFLLPLFASAVAAQQQTPVPPAPAAEARNQATPSFDQAAAAIEKQLGDSVTELARLRDKVAAEKIPLSQDLRELEDLLQNVRADLQRASRTLDSRTLDLDTLRQGIAQREQHASYLGNLLGEYARNFEARLHITELRRYRAVLDHAALARQNSQLSGEALFTAEAALVDASLDRLDDVLGGSRFEGKAVDPGGMVRPGSFVLVGPTAVFMAADGQLAGTAEQRLGSLEPT